MSPANTTCLRLHHAPLYYCDKTESISFILRTKEVSPCEKSRQQTNAKKQTNKTNQHKLSSTSCFCGRYYQAWYCSNDINKQGLHYLLSCHHNYVITWSHETDVNTIMVAKDNSKKLWHQGLIRREQNKNFLSKKDLSIGVER